MRVKEVAATAEDLIALTQDAAVREIIVASSLAGLPVVRLLPGQTLRGASEGTELRFRAGSDGVQLSSDNRVVGLQLVTSIERRALFNDTTVESLGHIELKGLVVIGRVQILARDRVSRGHVEVDALHIKAADATGESERPHGYGVYVLQGAFTLWNMQSDETKEITANLLGVSVGSLDNPVLGGGIFVSGAGDKGGRLRVQRLETGPVYSNGTIAPGTADTISGGVFTVYGAFVDHVENSGPVMTFGPNDMALDNWGSVDRWHAKEKITTLGSSGIGFVNFGQLGDLKVAAPIETFGQGARGFNVYAGTVDRSQFDRIVTHGDGAVGVQIAQPIGTMEVRRGVETFGGTGPSLVKGVVQTLSAIALSIKAGGQVKDIRIKGGLKTHGAGVVTLEQLGLIDSISVEGGFSAAHPRPLPVSP